MTERAKYIKCGICFKEFTDPKLLPCFHTICLPCLEDIAEQTERNGQFACPVCRALITIPDGGVRCFQSNFYIQTEDSRSFELDCDACGRNKSACHRCRQCDQMFCGSCRNIHLRMSSSRDHELVSILPVEMSHAGLDDVTSYCTIHTSEEATMVCKDCDELICRVCKTTLHKEHSSSTISAEMEEKGKQLRDLIDISENNLKEIEKDVRVVKRQAESKYTYFNEQISDLRKRRDLLISNINKKFKSFEDKIRHLNEEQLVLSNEMNENQKLTNEGFKQTIENAKETVETGENVKLVRDYDNIVQKLREIEVSLAPAVSGHKLMETVELCTTWLIKLNEQNSGVPNV